MSVVVPILLSSLVAGSVLFLRRPRRLRRAPSSIPRVVPSPEPPLPVRRRARRGYSGTVRVEFTDRAGARSRVEDLLRRQALRLETEALRPLEGGAVAAEYQVQFAARRDRDRIAGRLMTEARPFVRTAALS